MSTVAALNGSNTDKIEKSNDRKPKSAEETKKALSDFKSKIIEDTEKIIKEYLPIKIVQLSELFEEINNKGTEVEKLKYALDNDNNDNNDNNNNNDSTEGKVDEYNNNTNTNKNKTKNKNKNKNKSESKPKSNKRKRSFNEMATNSNSSSFDDKDKNKDNIKTEKELKSNNYCANNSEIAKLTETIKGEVEELIDYLDQIGLFINLHIPKIEDGNNFGVQIQEQMKGMVSGGQLSAQDFLRNVPKFHTLRAKLISKIMKYPNLMDYKKSIIELDYKQMICLKHCLRDLRNNYWILYDVLNKNWQKIVKPKGDKTNAFSIYK